jgi:asparagine synthase (glutamine-hydrolysing)
MCGIAGFVAREGPLPPSACEAVRRMSERMHLRGPDAEGIWAGAGVALGHRRLAILDLDSRSNQPMHSRDGNYSVVFNGEIYNFRQLRRELEHDGEVFHTTSDTEVLLALYAREGERMLPKLRGMFAFGIWDARRRELFLARDPYGIKPLYYSATKDGVVFASQVKALLASGLVSKASEPAGVAGFYLWGCVPEPWTLYRDVFALPAGCWLRVRKGKPEEPVQWSDIRDCWRADQKQVSNDELLNRVREAVTESVSAHLVSDVPVSVFLSGGIDSATIVGLTSQLGAKVEGVTIAFDEFSSQIDDELPDAIAIANHFGLPHYARRVTRDEFEQDIPQILDAMDQPSTDGVNTWFASKAAAERGYKVALSGVGGDELFFGYIDILQIPRRLTWGKIIASIPGASSALKPVFGYLAKGRAHPKIAGVSEFMGTVEGMYFLKRGLFLPSELAGLMDADEAREGLVRLGGFPPGMSHYNCTRNDFAVCMLDSTSYLRNQLLRDSDWASMHHSLELRTPLVDAALLNALKPYLSAFAHGAGKKLLASSPVNSLPEEIMNRPKSGFGLPMQAWLEQSSPQRMTPSRRKSPWARRWATIVMSEYGVGNPELSYMMHF